MISTEQTMSQGMQSCLEPLELEPYVLVPPKQERSENPCSELGENCESNRNRWNFVEALPKTSHNFKQIDDNSEQVYVHPLLKRSSSSMSTRSLELCTESLMSETGTDTFLSTEEFSYLMSEKKNSSTTKQPESCASKTVKRSNIFPPPLTSITGSNGVQMQAHREGGRLVIKAFALSSCRSSFEVERGSGRLTLSSLKNGSYEAGEKVEAEANFNGCLRGEKVGCNIRGGEWGNSRCDGDGILPSLPFCVAIS